MNKSRTSIPRGELTLLPKTIFFRERGTARQLRRQPNDHNFGSLLMLAVTADAFLFATNITAT
jgi:hypothetical protein